MDSRENAQEAITLYKELSTLWGMAGMHARKWISTSSEVLRAIPESARASEIDLDSGYLPSVKTLGVLWQAKEDIFTFKSISPSKSCNSNHGAITTMQVKETVSSILKSSCRLCRTLRVDSRKRTQTFEEISLPIHMYVIKSSTPGDGLLIGH